jgi:hypothetical protein
MLEDDMQNTLHALEWPKLEVLLQGELSFLRREVSYPIRR